MNKKFTAILWALRANVYEVNVRQYTPEGTFAAFQNHLSRLKEMGVEILWFMPITPISITGRKGTLGSYYACSSYEKTNPEFGSIHDFKQLVNEAHKLGLRVLIDWVANHTGCDHEWTVAHPEFYIKNSEGKFYDIHGWDDVIDLDFTNTKLWQAMTEAMRFWVSECDIDGFRCDMAHLVPLSFWDYARTTLDGRKKLFWMAETEQLNYHEVFDATYGWELLHAMEQRYQSTISVWQLADVLIKYQSTFPADALRLLFTSNHDENSHSGSEWERLGNGTKAFGILCSLWHNSLPLIYSGQELPNTKRLAFFEKDEIAWTSENELQSFYKTLLQLRQNNAAFQAGDETIETRMLSHSAPFNVLAFCRKKGNDEVLVLLNLSHDGCKVRLYDYQCNSLSEVFTNVAFNGEELDLEAWSYKLFA